MKPQSNIIIYQTEDGQTKIQTRLVDESMRKIGNADFSTKPTNFYNLDVIISVGYRVKSLQGIKSRRRFYRVFGRYCENDKSERIMLK